MVQACHFLSTDLFEVAQGKVVWEVVTACLSQSRELGFPSPRMKSRVTEFCFYLRQMQVYTQVCIHRYTRMRAYSLVIHSSMLSSSIEPLLWASRCPGCTGVHMFPPSSCPPGTTERDLRWKQGLCIYN